MTRRPLPPPAGPIRGLRHPHQCQARPARRVGTARARRREAARQPTSARAGAVTPRDGSRCVRGSPGWGWAKPAPGCKHTSATDSAARPSKPFPPVLEAVPGHCLQRQGTLGASAPQAAPPGPEVAEQAPAPRHRRAQSRKVSPRGYGPCRARPACETVPRHGTPGDRDPPAPPPEGGRVPRQQSWQPPSRPNGPRQGSWPPPSRRWLP